MEKQNTGIVESPKTKIGGKDKTESGDTRPVKWIQEGKNVWRIVYAD